MALSTPKAEDAPKNSKEHRASVRKALKKAGFKRTSSSKDKKGDGVYGELWHDQFFNAVVISWTERDGSAQV